VNVLGYFLLLLQHHELDNLFLKKKKFISYSLEAEKSNSKFPIFGGGLLAISKHSRKHHM
jgi:hypothetical protein